jgi:ubiquinone biosynthesis protein COQ9
MMGHPERLPERDAAIDAMLPHVPELGWTRAALAAGLKDAGLPEEDADLLFPLGPADMVETFVDLADRRMEQDAAAADFAGKGLTKRVRGVIALRLARWHDHKDAVRRGLGLLSLPQNARAGAASLARTVDSIWHAAGDTSADFSWYTKRAILAGVYSATMLAWLRDESEDDAATLAFLDRRLADVGRIGKARARLEGMLGRLRPRAA